MPAPSGKTTIVILSVCIFTVGFVTATHAQEVNTIFKKRLPEAPGKEIEVITVTYTRSRRQDPPA